jgi:hypothetical protein
MIGGELENAVAEPDVPGALGLAAARKDSGDGECEYSSRK